MMAQHELSGLDTRPLAQTCIPFHSIQGSCSGVIGKEGAQEWCNGDDLRLVSNLCEVGYSRLEAGHSS